MNERDATCINTDGVSSLKYYNSYDSMKISGASITSMTSPPFSHPSQMIHSMFDHL
ncbi:hypothetical protein ACLZX5_07795 [Enterococcus faecium]